jgi:hypothetical protein
MEARMKPIYPFPKRLLEYALGHTTCRMDGQNSERKRPMFQVRNFLSVTGSFLKRTIAASTIAAVVSISTRVIGISLIAMAGVGGSLIIDGSQHFNPLMALESTPIAPAGRMENCGLP